MSDLQEQFRRAVLGNDYDAIEKCIKQGVDVNAADDRGETALHMSMRLGSANIIIMLLDAGSDPNHADVEGVTPFMAGVNAEKYANAQFAIDYKADVNFQPTPDILPPLYRAMFYDTINGTSKRTAFMLERGASLDMGVTLSDGSVKTLIQYALECDKETHSERFYKLIKNHCNRDIRSEQAKVVATKSTHDHIVSVLASSSKADGNKFKLGR